MSYNNWKTRNQDDERLGPEIVEEAFEAFDRWCEEWADDLEGLCVADQTVVYGYMIDGIDIDLAKAMLASDKRDVNK